MNPRNAWPAVVLAGIALGVIAAMAIAGVQKDVILLSVASLVTPVLAALVAAQVAETRSAVHNVQQQSNGNQTRMLEMIERQTELLAASQPPTHDEPAASEGG